MESLFNVNGLMFWSEREIRLRRQFEEHFAAEMKEILLAENSAWRFVQIEGPLLTPRDIINPNYTNDDVWVQETPTDEVAFLQAQLSDIKRMLDNAVDDPLGTLSLKHRKQEIDDELSTKQQTPTEDGLVLRPETTPSSYVAACHLLNNHSGIKPPFVVWQTGKSFRREQDQVTKNMRLKEFYQQEFQCIYTADTMNDYHTAVLEPVRKMIGEMIGLPTRVIASDRLPSYSEITMDVEVWVPNDAANIQIDKDGRWMEICSISRRIDFPQKANFQTKKKIVEKDLLVLEVAVGLDRILYCYEQRCKNILR